MTRKLYNDEFKTAAAKLVRDQGYTIKKAAQSLGIDQGSIRTWVRTHAPALAPLATDASPSSSSASSSASARRTAVSSWSARF